jgi:surface antigen
MRTGKLIPVLTALALASAGCATVSESVAGSPKGWGGGMVGSAAGGLIAAAIDDSPAAIIGGVLLGGLLGGALGNALDQRDKELAMRQAQQTFEHGRTGQAGGWSNPDTGHYGSITPTRTYQDASGRYCREYQQTIVVEGEKHEAYGTACRQPDGSWKITD